jgi:hypothetical protein
MAGAAPSTEVLRTRFLAIYPTIPINLRNEIIALAGEKNEPVTWTTAYIEILESTEKGKEILNHLYRTGVLEE